MHSGGFPWLSLLLALPLAGAVAMYFVTESSARWIALVATLADLFVALPLWWLFDPQASQMQFTEHVAWITAPPIYYSLGLDGISLPLVLMTAAIMPLCVLASWSAITTRVQGFMAMLLVMETAMVGVFVALDFVLFYVFWEAMLIPMYLLIGVWGGSNRLYAAIKFFLYTLAGSVLLLVAIFVAMTGKRVVFLVDMSGSMGKRDLNTVDDTKWPLVIETVCKVMRSIATLEQYQVLVFSSGANWVFGTGEWQPFAGEKSVEAVSAALLKVKPKDDTNVYAAMDKAFTLRAAGLDTVYLFSDGLPTSGPGLTLAQQNANLSESELGAILGRHVRDTLARTWNRPAVGQPRVKINSVGFFFDSPDVGAFLWSLSRDNDGSFVGMSKP